MTRDEKPRRDGPRKPRRAPESRRAPEPLAGAPAPEQRQRIAKLMARVGLCSRRDAEVWIVEGRVSLNGAVLTSPATDVGPDDAILVDDAPLPNAEKTRLFLFHKPRGLVTSDRDPEGRATVADYLRDHWPDGPRVVTIGRLDINTEGLLLLTNDGGLARVLELPKTGWVRRYRVRAKGETDQGVLDGLFHGVSIDGVDYAGIEAKLDRAQGANCWLTMGLREGKNREVKRVLEHIGLEVNRLIRLSFGPFQLLDLPEGAVEEVKTRILRDQLGESLAAAAGVDFQEAEAVRPVPTTKATPRGDPRPSDRARVDRKPVALAHRDHRTDGRPSQGRADQERPRRPVEPGRERTPRRDSGRAERDGMEPPKQRERPAAGTRRHVSTLRAAEADAARKGPRKRIERSDTRDRRDRAITVERLVAPEPTRSRRGADRFATRAVERIETGRHASPSARAKQVRIARSGGERDAGHGHREEGANPAARRGPRDQAEGAPPRRTERGDARRGRSETGQRDARHGDARHGDAKHGDRAHGRPGVGDNRGRREERVDRAAPRKPREKAQGAPRRMERGDARERGDKRVAGERPEARARVERGDRKPPPGARGQDRGAGDRKPSERKFGRKPSGAAGPGRRERPHNDKPREVRSDRPAGARSSKPPPRGGPKERPGAAKPKTRPKPKPER